MGYALLGAFWTLQRWVGCVNEWMGDACDSPAVTWFGTALGFVVQKLVILAVGLAIAGLLIAVPAYVFWSALSSGPWWSQAWVIISIGWLISSHCRR